MSEDAALERYFKEAASWDADRIAMNVRSNRIAWRIAIGACALTVILGLALFALMPLKRVEPFLIRVDTSTGIVDVVPVFTGGAAMPETVTRYFLSHYVTVCEATLSISPLRKATMRNVRASTSAGRVTKPGTALWDRGNPLSPLAIHKDGSTVRAEVGAVTFFQRGSGVQDLAQVRYTKSTCGGPETPRTKSLHWIATISYAYSDPAHDARARRWNPLGFKVIDFKSEPEVESTPASITASPTKATAPVPEATP